MWWVVLATLGLAVAPTLAHADDDGVGAGVVIFARGAALYQVDPRGRGETEVAQLPAKARVRALRSDENGSVLLVDLAGKWAWLPLDGATKTLTELPCADGPAQLAEDGSAVLCRDPRAATQSLLVELPRAKSGALLPKPTTLAVPPSTARLVIDATGRKLIWADATGVWSAPAADLKRKQRVAPDVPLRGFLASPDGERAIATYADQIYATPRQTAPAEVLMTVQLDGRGPRRKAIRDGVAVEWSHDGEWVLVQDGASSCLMRAGGGQYKCWKGYTAASLSPDGRWGLALGNRDGVKPDKASKPSKNGKGDKKPKPPEPAPARDDEPTDEPEAATDGLDGPAAMTDDVSVAPPSGPLSLYRLRLEGAFTDRPALIVKVVDGAAVWVPKP